MGTELIPSNIQLPAHLAARGGEGNKAAMGGIKAGGFPRISIGGSKFSIVENGEKVLITSPDNPELPAMQLELVIVGFNASVSKLYYEGEYEEGSDKEPTCSSDNGVTPDPHIVKPVHNSCASCPMNVWGSKINKQGKQIKACSDNKRLAVIPAHDIAEEQALDLTIKPSSLKDWAQYVRALDSKGIPVDGVVTKVQFDPQATYPKLIFKFGRFLTAEESALVEKRSKGDDVRLITSPRQTTATGPVQQPVPAASPAPAAPVAPAAPAAPVAPMPAPAAPVAPAAPAAPAVVDPYAGLPVHVKAAVEGAGGLTSPAGAQVYKVLTGKDVPSAAPAAPKPVDPYEGQPAHVKASVDAAGGLASTGGAVVYKALTGKDAPSGTAASAAPEQPKPARRSRSMGKKADAPAPTPPAAPAAPAAPAVATAAMTPPAAPAALAQSYASAPTGGLGGDLDALLATAMATPAAPAK